MVDGLVGSKKRLVTPQATRTVDAQRRTACWAVAVWVVLSGGQLAISGEQWTDSSGKHVVEADFLGLTEAGVSLKLVDGRVIEVPLDRLSPASRTKAQGMAADPFGPGPSPFEEPAVDAGTVSPAIDESVRAEPLIETKVSGKIVPVGDASLVTAQGVGFSPEESLADAFRTAVRRVVGTLLDARTVSENDEIVEDSIISHSRGFVKSYEEIDGSRKLEGGLHHVAIRALVETQRVRNQLKVSTEGRLSFDGAGLAAELQGKADDREAATQILKRLLLEVPALLNAEVAGEPKYRSDVEGMMLPINLEADVERYNQFVSKLTPVLEKVAIHQLEAVISATNQGRDGSLEAIGRVALRDPTLSNDERELGVIWVCDRMLAEGNTLRFKGYVTRADLPTIDREIGQNYSQREGRSHHLHISALNSKLEPIAEREVTLEKVRDANQDISHFTWLRRAFVRDHRADWQGRESHSNRYIDDLREDERAVLVIAPVLMDVDLGTIWSDGNWRENVSWMLRQSAMVRLPLAESDLKDVRQFTAKVVWRPRVVVGN